jgi:ubiquinone/menaquinone biosynthesis C-methylase UbiE
MSDAVAMKNKEHKAWSSLAPGWRTHDAYLVRASAPVTERMLQLAEVAPGNHVLDIATGTGEPAIPAAHKVAPAGHVIATDFVDEMLAFAREKAARAGITNIEFRRVDGEALDFPDGSFDAVTSRFGIMFMPEPDTCLRAAHRVLKPGGRVAVATWAAPDKNAWVSTAAGILRTLANAPAPQPGAPGIFAFADDRRLRGALEGAGFHHVKLEPVELTIADHDTPAAYLTFLLDVAGPLATLWAQLGAEQKEAAAAEISKHVAAKDGRVKMNGVAWVAAGTK